VVLKNKKEKKYSLLVNESSPFSQVLLIIDKENKILSKQEALQKAQNVNLDLLCVAPHSNPPVCKLVNYQKYVFELSKKKKPKKENREKEIRVSLTISENDLQVKLNKVKCWLDKKHIVKTILLIKGREKSQQELAYEKCQKIIEELKLQSPKIELRGNIHSHNKSLYFFLTKGK
jgi:translation initiation factor IF-3